MTKDAPCLGCQERYPGCHGSCERYLEYQQSRKVYNYNISKKRNADRGADDFRLGNAHKLKNK